MLGNHTFALEFGPGKEKARRGHMPPMPALSASAHLGWSIEESLESRQTGQVSRLGQRRLTNARRRAGKRRLASILVYDPEDSGRRTIDCDDAGLH
jgi:hypothetical protein